MTEKGNKRNLKSNILPLNFIISTEKCQINLNLWLSLSSDKLSKLKEDTAHFRYKMFAFDINNLHFAFPSTLNKYYLNRRFCHKTLYRNFIKCVFIDVIDFILCY